MFDYEARAIRREYDDEQFSDAINAVLNNMSPDEIHQLWIDREVYKHLDMSELDDSIDLLRAEVKHEVRRAQAELASATSVANMEELRLRRELDLLRAAQ